MSTLKNVQYALLLVVLSFLLKSQQTLAQEVMLEKSPYDYNDPNPFGKNRPFFLHYYIAWGSFIQTDAAMEYSTKTLRSFDFEYGIRLKFKVTNWLSLGSTLNYSVQKYNFATPTFNLSYQNNLFNTDKLVSQSFGIAPYLRLNFGKHGNEIGKYIDFGYFVLFGTNRLKDFSGPDDEQVKTVIINPEIIATQKTGVYVNIGYQRLSIFAKYRLDSMMKITGIMDAPKLSIGMQIGIF
jgi:hypothetical protein